MKSGDLEWLATANIGAGQFVVAPYHVGLGFGEAGAVPLVGAAGQLSLFAPYDPVDLVFGGLTAFGAGQEMGSLLAAFVKKVPFFHPLAFWGPECGKTLMRIGGRLFPVGQNLFHTHTCNDETQARAIFGDQSGQGQRA